MWGASASIQYSAGIEQRAFRDQVGEIGVPVEYGRNLVLELPVNVTHWRLQGRLIDFSSVDIVGSNSGGGKGQPVIEFVETARTAEKFVVVYRVKRPGGL